VNDFVLNNANEITDIIALSNITRTTTSLTTTDLILKTGALTTGNYLVNTLVVNNTNLTVAFDQRLLTLGAVLTTPVTAINGTGYINDNLSLSTPDANITLTIPNGIRATLSDGSTPISYITSYAPTAFNSTLVGAASGSNLKFLGKNITLLPAGAIFDPYILIRINYSDADIPDGVSEDSLKVYWYNGTTGTWTPLITQEHNKIGNYLIAQVTHFSIFSLLGTVTPGAPGSGGGGSGSSGCGSGVVTREPSDNIARLETIEKCLDYSKSVPYMFKLPELNIYEIVIMGTENENYGALRVESLKGPTKIAGISTPPETVYKNLNIWFESKRIKEALIKFKVENTWIKNNNIASRDILMIRWNGNEWTKLETLELNKDDTNTFYEAKTDGFSSFAIIALKDGAETTPGVTEIAGTPVKPRGTEKATSAPTENKTSGFEAIVAVFAIAAYFVINKKGK
ncbi:MAG: PGF-pre-PGF domain-containing protein, partial [Candidatus Methanoperedens sp.]|nr:PGF-pre-PGF domain-containing protein [Candidatus Methanoperedens sp.]